MQVSHLAGVCTQVLTNVSVLPVSALLTLVSGCDVIPDYFHPPDRTK